MAFMKKAKAYVRRQGKRVIRAAKKRYVKKGKLNISKLSADVQMLKHLVNTEKKRVDISLAASQVAQYFGAVSGQYAAGLSPTIPQQVQQGGRTGNSVKLVSGVLDLRLAQQSSAVNNIKVKVYIVCRPDNSAGTSATNSLNEFIEVNPFSGVNDYYSNRDPEYFKAFRIITQKTYTLKQDSIIGGTSIIQTKIPLKFNHHQKYNSNASTTTTSNQFYIFMVASDGDTSASTGVGLQWTMRWYYTDN